MMLRTNESSQAGRGWIIAAASLCMLTLMPAAFAATDETADDPWAGVDSSDDFGAETERVIGRVVGLRGTVYAQTPGEARRLLTENAPIYPGDRIITVRGAQLGVLSGEYYTGLSEDTTLTYKKQGRRAPEVALERGDVRLINAGEGENARIATPGMLAKSGGSDTSAFVVQEKAWMVSIVCALEGQVTVADEAGRSLVVAEGGCAASKPAEGLFLAGAAVTDTPVAQAMSAADDSPVAGVAANRFPNPDVGAPGGFAAFAARPPIRGASVPFGLIQPCDSPSSGCQTSATGAPGGGFPPTNGWVGGQLPP